MKTATIKITGMTCMGCVNSVKTILKNLNGVIEVDATLDPAQATVQFEPDRITLDQLTEAIVDAGFGVEA